MIQDGAVRYHDSLGPLMVPIDSVQQHPENYNGGDVERVIESIEVNGMYRPIYVQRSTDRIIAGNHTWEACASLGASQVPVVFLDVDETKATQIMVADNRIASLAMPDYGQLTRLLMSIGGENPDLLGTGYTPKDLEVIQHLSDIPVESNEFGSWPTLTFTVHPQVAKGFREMTREADGDGDAFELLLRLAGWRRS